MYSMDAINARMKNGKVLRICFHFFFHFAQTKSITNSTLKNYHQFVCNAAKVPMYVQEKQKTYVLYNMYFIYSRPRKVLQKLIKKF